MGQLPKDPENHPGSAEPPPLDPALGGIEGVLHPGAEGVGNIEVTVRPADSAAAPDAALAIEFRSAARIEEALTLSIDLDYVESLGTLAASPEPVADSNDGMCRILDFPGPGAASCRIDITGSIPRPARRDAAGELGVYIGGIHVADFDLRTGRPR